MTVYDNFLSVLFSVIPNAGTCGNGTTLEYKPHTNKYSCTAVCGNGTRLVDGSCTAVCGNGTTLEDGSCIVDEDVCGNGTRFKGGQCIIANKIEDDYKIPENDCVSDYDKYRIPGVPGAAGAYKQDPISCADWCMEESNCKSFLSLPQPLIWGNTKIEGICKYYNKDIGKCEINEDSSTQAWTKKIL